MDGPDDDGVHRPTEILQGGPRRPPVWERIPAEWRPHAAAALAFVIGVAVGVGALVARLNPPEPAAFRAHEHAVELVLFQAVPARNDASGREVPVGPLQVDSGLLLSGLVTSTVSAITMSAGGLDVRVPALPVTVSPTGRFHEVAVEVIVGDCAAAKRWTPRDRPFAITWRDEYDMEHTDRAGDFGPSVATSLTRYIDSVCRPASRS